MSYFWICFLHAFLPAIIAFIYFSVVNFYTKSYNTWTVGKELLHISIVLLLIGIENFLLRDLIYDNPNNWSFRYFFEEIRNAFLVGMLIVMIIIPFNYSLLLHKNIKSAQEVKEKSPKFLNESAVKLIHTQVKSDEFELYPNDLIVVRSDGNYSEFFIHSKDDVIKLLKRISLKELEQQLSDFPQLMKTHRGWLVNLNSVTQTTGNAGGYQLTLTDFAEKVPVSRSIIPQFNERMSSLNA
ncbi:LytTR family DNA-binding domain-containing protein [Marivirga aurantiaca]|nr:LytTR family DNA-binding domain-containing protein [Marivirga aurantiaca]